MRHPNAFQALDDLPTGGVGLLFGSFQQSITNQFAFLQHRWANHILFKKGGAGPTGLDPIIGQDAGQKVPQLWRKEYGGASRVRRASVEELADLDLRQSHETPFAFGGFVRFRGGEFFFAPRMSCVFRWRNSCWPMRSTSPARIVNAPARWVRRRAAARLTMRDGFSFDEACEIMKIHHGITLSRSALWAMYRASAPRAERRFVSDGSLQSIASTAPSPYECLAGAEAQVHAGRAIATLGALLRGLPCDERQLLEFRFRRGLKTAEIAKLLRLQPKRLYRTFEQLLRRLRLALEDAGYGADEVLAGIGAVPAVSKSARGARVGVTPSGDANRRFAR